MIISPKPQTIYISHLDYTVKVIVRKKFPPECLEGDAFVPDAVHMWKDRTSKLYFHPRVPASVVVHELVHVLQNICRQNGMKVETEMENLAYIMDNLFSKIGG